MAKQEFLEELFRVLDDYEYCDDVDDELTTLLTRYPDLLAKYKLVGGGEI